MMFQEDNLEDFKGSNAGFSDRNGNKPFAKRHRGCPICSANYEKLDYKDPEFLSNFISEGGRILPGRVTGVCSKHQRDLKKTIRLSRIIALLPFICKIR